MIEARKALGWTRKELSQRLDCDERVLRAMEAGERAIPPDITTWLDRLVRFIAENPAPRGWKNEVRARAGRGGRD